MHPSHRPAQLQQQRMRDHVEKADSLTMFNVLTGPHLLERIGNRGRTTESLSNDGLADARLTPAGSGTSIGKG